MSDFEYRAGTPDDALCVGALATQVFLDTYATDGVRVDLAREVLSGYSPEAFLARLRDEATSFVLAEKQGHLVGFVELTRGRPCPVAAAAARVELVRLYVQRPFQRRGIGRRLMSRAEALARQRGEPAVWLAAWSGNRRAHGFYRALQYTNVGAVEHVIEGRAYENRVFLKTMGGS